MNAKWHTYEWLKGQKPAPEALPAFPELSKAEMGQLSEEERNRLQEELDVSKAVLEREVQSIQEFEALYRSIDGRNAFCVNGHGVSEAEFPDFRTKLQASQKFAITDDFRQATLARLATPATVLKAKELFKLSHNPMWLEWRRPPSETRGNQKWGTVLFQSPDSESEEILGYYVLVIEHGFCAIGSYRFDPSSLRFQGNTLAIDVERTDPDRKELSEDERRSQQEFALSVTDFVIRINSPRITDVSPCDDLSTINKKRHKNGKLPLFSYHVVDLNRQVKVGLRAIEIAQRGDDNQGKVRQHWRRGHFKCCRTGVFWWNPHLAGRADLGVIAKEYAA
jgi:hypothetical protein